ncbi:MAG: beta-galactosidase [Clostridia bacterium]|nr:beta-galactosidase [Clostridia bacterium]
MFERFLIGCCYYPEHWDRDSMKNDMARIKSLGFNCIRMGEFSWSIYEREEGKYDFSFLVSATEEAQRLGISVILGTPTAAPPKWLIDKYPEVLAKNKDGILMQHGSRQHHNHTSAIYLRYCKKITEEMVKCFCGFKNVIGWQIDNEFNCHRRESYSESDDAAFRIWLEKKYKTVDNLNKSWGNTFWSLDFNSFSQVHCPRPNPAYNNPSWITDYYLFLSDTVVNYAAVQTRIIRKYMPDAFITHNGYFENIDYKKLTRECLDFLSFDSYPAFQEKNKKALGRNVAYRLAQVRSCSEKYLILEQQSGPGGQLSYLLPTPLPGQIRLWTYQDIAHGAAGVLYFRYRTALFGAEQLWYGIYGHDGEENYRSREIRQITSELEKVGDIFLKSRPERNVAIYYDYHNASADKVESFAKSDARFIFGELNLANIHADLVSRDDDFDNYKVVIIPHITVADEELAAKLEAFAKKGGVVIISARSGVKDENVHYRKLKAPGVFRSLVGASVDWFTAISNHDAQSVAYGEKEYAISDYYEMLVPEGAEVIGTYTDGFCKDKAAIVKHQNVYYFGFYSNNSADIYIDIIKKHIHHKEPVSPDVEEINMSEYTLYLNHGYSEVSLSGYDEIGGEAFDKIPPFGVVLVKRN